ncbi:hypothetical protein PanWU01x14_330000 [Parasponia andersonii]|uniref:Uncharacterized protein n=1 Tax=Parasponia andersonii TaxID=3476 RepID=A0A2P5AI92_PARAD|nr:hypothetical protein PanWU01x14_330000 [Parasponia andersonii]
MDNHWLLLKILNPKWKEVALDLKLWADEVAIPIDLIETNEHNANLAQDFKHPSIAATTDILNNEEHVLPCHTNLSSENIAHVFDHTGSSSVKGSKSDSLNTSDLSPTKVFTSHDEGWQKVQSCKKKKAP